MLNKNGWGLKEMLILSGVLAIFLVIAVYYIYSLYKTLDEEVSNNYYYELEEKLENQAKVYLEDYYDSMLTSDYVTISRDVLRAYNLDVTLQDNNGNACSGYVKANKTRGKISIKGYISCPKYSSEGYESWRVE